MLNYTPQAITDLLQRQPGFRARHPQDGDAILRVTDVMRSAQKFILPDYGSLIYDRTSVPEGLTMTRLPYPEILIEVPFPGAPNDLDNLAGSTRRIIIAEEGIEERLQFRGLRPLEVPNSIRMTVVCWFDEHRMWILQAAAAVLPIGAKTVPSTRDADDPFADSRIGNVAFTFNVHPILPGIDRETRQLQSEATYRYAASNDLGTEMRILAEMLAVLECRNVSTEIVSAPPKLNKARIRNRKELLHDYHVLVVGGSNLSHGVAAAHPGDDYLVKQHLRRGHIRRLSENHRVWVNQTIVAAGSGRGILNKDYKVTSRRASANV